MTVYEQGSVSNDINTTCNCTVTSHHSGKLKAKTITCINVITVINTTGTLNRSLCNNEISIDVYPGSELFLNFKPVNRATTVSQIPHQIVSIFFQGPDGYRNGSFSVTCGSALRKITTPSNKSISTTFSFKGEITTRTSALPYPKDTVDELSSKPAINDDSTISDTVTHGHYLNHSKTKFPYMYVVAAGSLVVVAIIIFVFICIRRENCAQNTSKEDRQEDGTSNNATNGIERPENVEPSKQQQQLPDNTLYHSYLVNEDCGYSTCGNESIVSTEQLPYNPLYHSYQANGGKEDSKYYKDEAGTLLLQDSNAVYAQPNKLTRASNANHNDSNESQFENVYAQVNKTKKT
ncbi:uncharacterized protein LOC111102483 isoform X2 [Crassostrea virginica]